MPSLIGRCGGGGSITELIGYYSGNPTAPVTPGGAGFVTWDTLYAGSAVLDLSNPAAPTVTRTGYWAVSASAGFGTLVVTAGAISTMQLDVGSASMRQGAPPSSVTFPAPQMACTIIAWLTSGDAIDAFIVHDDPTPREVALDNAAVAFLGGS